MDLKKLLKTSWSVWKPSYSFWNKEHCEALELDTQLCVKTDSGIITSLSNDSDFLVTSLALGFT